MHERPVKILSGTANADLARRIVEVLKRRPDSNIEDAEYDVGRFPDGEVQIEPDGGELGNVRDRDVFIINSITPPTALDPRDHFMEMLLLIDAAHRSSAGRITAVVPYLGYNRQDRKVKPRVPISAAVVMKIITQSGANRVLVCDLHSEATMTNFDPIGQDEVYASTVAVPHLQSILEPPFTVASPDVGGTKRAAKFAHFLGTKDLVTVNKGERPKPGALDEDRMQLIGEVEGKNVIIVDDIVGSGGTMVASANLMKRAGARSVRVFGTHAVFSGNAVERLDTCEAIDQVIVTDTIHHDARELATKRLSAITVLPMHEFFAEAIMHVHKGTSISKMILK